MQFASNRPSRQRRTKLYGERRNDLASTLYSHHLQFYSAPPLENISLQEFETLAVERLKALKAVETVGIRHVRGSEGYKDAMVKELKKLNLKCLYRNSEKYGKEVDNEMYDERRWDHISHFILRLAYCRSEDLRRWFIQQEMDLFRFRFCNEPASSIESFLQQYQLRYSPISDKEKSAISNELTKSGFNLTGHDVQATNYYKVPFIDVLDLVRVRKVYLSKGFAFVPHSELVSIILTVFRTNLSHDLALTCRSIPQLAEDNRLLPMLNGLSKRYLGQDYNSKKAAGGQVTADMIDGLSQQAFPMCMKQLHQHLRQNSHMRHGGRMQYGLFLKGIGMSLEEAMRFWRMGFSKVVDADKFDKSYSYNIRHNYGKEGKRADYTPYSCIKIITSNGPGPGDSHGCPFRHSDGDLLRQKIAAMPKMSKDHVDEVMDLVKKSHFQVACGRLFEVVHGIDYNFVPNHPNQYFDESQHVTKGISKDHGSAGTNTPSTIKPRSQPSQQDSVTTQPHDDFDDFPVSLAEMEEAMQGVEKTQH